MQVVLILFLFFMNILSASFWLDQSSRLTRDYGYIIMVTLLPPEPPMSLLCYMPEKSKFFENVSFPCFLKKYTYSVHVWLTFSIGQGPFIEWEIFNCSCTNLKMEFLIIITNHKENREYVFMDQRVVLLQFFQSILKIYEMTVQGICWKKSQQCTRG